VSGPKSGDYHVVSEAELRRRRIAAAKDRHSRVLAAVQAFRGTLAAAEATYGRLGVSVPQATVSRPGEAEDWDRTSDALTSGLSQAKDELAETVRVARLRMLSAEGAQMSAVLVEERRPAKPARAESARAESARAESARAESARAESVLGDRKLAEVLGRLPAEAPAEVVARGETLARGFREASGPSEKARVLDGLRLLVQAEQDRQTRIARNSAVIEELYRELDGLRSNPVDTCRGVLKGLDPAAALPAGLRDRVAAVKAAAEAERDTEFVLATAARALAELGYAVGEDFRTVVPSSGALLELPHSPRHGLQIRERNHRLMLNVVRFDADGRRDPRADKDAEESFCGDFAKLKGRMRAEGVDLSMLRADAPGQTPIQVLRDTPDLRRSARRSTAPAQRERSS
jgi:hypothetical protein